MTLTVGPLDQLGGATIASVAKAIGSVPEIPLASMVKVGIKFTVHQTGVFVPFSV